VNEGVELLTCREPYPSIKLRLMSYNLRQIREEGTPPNEKNKQELNTTLNSVYTSEFQEPNCCKIEEFERVEKKCRF
jgi:hypothetical protein